MYYVFDDQGVFSRIRWIIGSHRLWPVRGVLGPRSSATIWPRPPPPRLTRRRPTGSMSTDRVVQTQRRRPTHGVAVGGVRPDAVQRGHGGGGGRVVVLRPHENKAVSNMRFQIVFSDLKWRDAIIKLILRTKFKLFYRHIHFGIFNKMLEPTYLCRVFVFVFIMA